MTREEILNEAKKCVCGKREQDYGSPESNFGLIADLWSVYLRTDISEVDVAMMMGLLKIARIKNGGGTGDSFVDLAGYAACGGELNDIPHSVRNPWSEPGDDVSSDDEGMMEIDPWIKGTPAEDLEEERLLKKYEKKKKLKYAIRAFGNLLRTYGYSEENVEEALTQVESILIGK